MSRRKSPDTIVAKYKRNIQGSLGDMEEGINSVSIAPAKQAIAKQDKMLANLTASVTSGKWARGLANVSLEDWKQKIINKGLPRIADGVENATAKLTDFHQKMGDFQESLKREIESMPDTTPEQRINRAVAWIRGMAKFKK